MASRAILHGNQGRGVGSIADDEESDLLLVKEFLNQQFGAGIAETTADQAVLKDQLPS